MQSTLKKLMVLGAFLLISSVSFGQPPPGGGGHGSNENDPVGGGAPLIGGLSILLALAAGYGARKVYNARREFRKK
jgi:hypothetical protein